MRGPGGRRRRDPVDPADDGARRRLRRRADQRADPPPGARAAGPAPRPRPSSVRQLRGRGRARSLLPVLRYQGAQRARPLPGDPGVWVAGVCDKGAKKSRNEDAMALLAGEQPGSRAVLVVLDGVSNLVDSDVASLAGASAAREVLRTPLPAGMGTPQSKDAAVAKVFTDAAAAANTAIIAITDPDEPNPASATFTVAVLEGTRISHANIGDSRCYWLPDQGEPVQLTVDDSVAQAQIATRRGQGGRRDRRVRPRHHQVARARLAGLRPTSSAASRSPDRAGCSRARTGCGTTPPRRARSVRRCRRPPPPTPKGSRSSWWRSPTQRADTTTSPQPWPASGRSPLPLRAAAAARPPSPSRTRRPTPRAPYRRHRRRCRMPVRRPHHTAEAAGEGAPTDG